MARTLEWERSLDPSELLDWDVDWSNDLGSDTISSSSWAMSASNEDAALTKSSPSATSDTTKIWLTAGTSGRKYDLVNTIVTTGGRTLERTIRIVVEQR